MRMVLLAAAALLGATHSASASDPEVQKQEAELRELQSLDQRLFSVGWKLVTGNAEFCENAAPAIGMLLHDANTYRNGALARGLLGLTGDIGVQAVAPGSPAEKAGLRANHTLGWLEGIALIARYPQSDPAWQRLIDVNDAIDAKLSETGRVSLSWHVNRSDKMSAEIVGIPACPTRFEVNTSGSRAVADGTRVIIGKKQPAFAYAEDEFAALVAHELAHNLLRHRALFDEVGRKRKLVRLTERDADRMMPWLLANAGYDPHAASRFMARWGPKHGGGLLRKRTHDGWDERGEFIEAEIELVEHAVAETGKADWSTRFVAMADDYERK